MSKPFPAADGTNPSEIYRRDLQCAAVIVSGLCVGGGLVGGLVFGTHGELMGGLVGGFGLGLAIGLGSGFGPVIKLAWTERIWTLGGSTVRFIPLLQTALDRQVLRQAGAVYQFRHAALQDLLADSAQVDSLVADAKWGGS